MNPNKFIQSVIARESKDIDTISDRLINDRSIRLLHASFGITTESGEFTDILKKYFFYGKPIDITNAKEELGDLLWYIALAADELNISFEELMETNYNKLKARYGDVFSEEKALNRNLYIERATLED